MALWSWLEWDQRGRFRWAAAGAVGLVIAVQVVWTLGAIRQNTYRTAFLPAMEYLAREAGPDARIIGGTELGFYFGFYNNVTDDTALGYYSGKRADFIVVDENGYGEVFKGFPARDPALDRYVRKTLTEDYHPVYKNAVYTIYRR